MKTVIRILLLVSIMALAACQSPRKLAADFAEYEKLGVKEVVVTGKFSHTDYTVTHENGKRKAVINHSNAWVPQIRIVRETEEKLP